jgi:MFS transporter, DHA1 family, multidrug resistance protein
LAFPSPPLPGIAAASPLDLGRRNRIAVNLAAGLVFFGFTLVMPFLPLYVEELGVRGVGRIAFWSGLLLSVPPLLAALLGPFWGRLGERLGMKLMVERVLITMTVVWALTTFAGNVYQVLALRILLGIFSGFTAMSASLVTHSCPPERIGRAIGSLQAIQILSTAVGPLAGAVLFVLVGIRNAFLVTSGCCVTALALILILYRDLPAFGDPAAAAGPAATRLRHSGWGALRALPGFLALIPYLFFVNLVDRSFPTIIPLVVQSMIGDFPAKVAATSGILVTSNALAAALSAYLLGRWATYRPPAPVLIGVLGGAALATFLMLFCHTPLQFLVLRVLAGLLSGGALTLGYAAAGPVIPAERRASLYAILSSAALLGGAIGPMASGALVGIRLRAPFVAVGATYLALIPWVSLKLGRLPAAAPVSEPLPEVRARPVNQA